MARTKAYSHKSSFSPAVEPHRDTSVSNLAARQANAAEGLKSLSHVTFASAFLVPTDWNSARIKEDQESSHTKELKKAHHIIQARLKGETVTRGDLKWAIQMAEKEKVMEDAEIHEALTTQDVPCTVIPDSEAGSDSWEDEVVGDQQGQTRTHLTAENLDKLNCDSFEPASIEQDLTMIDNSSSTSSLSVVSNVSVLNPSVGTNQVKDSSKREIVRSREQCARDLDPRGEVSDNEHPLLDMSMTKDKSDTDPESLRLALDTLEYNDNPPDRPPWLTGLRKPLPHPSLTTLQNFEVKTRFWVDEIARLQHLRAKLAAPKGAHGGEWHYEHFGSTVQVNRRMGGRSKNVFARGVWRYMVGGEKTHQGLDDFPLSLEGETLGWGTNEDLEEYRAEAEESDGPE